MVPTAPVTAPVMCSILVPQYFNVFFLIVLIPSLISLSFRGLLDRSPLEFPSKYSVKTYSIV